MGVCTGNHIEIYRAAHRAVHRDNCTAIDHIGGYTADYRTFLIY
jgi:hypothetical protein